MLVIMLSHAWTQILCGGKSVDWVYVIASCVIYILQFRQVKPPSYFLHAPSAYKIMQNSVTKGTDAKNRICNCQSDFAVHNSRKVFGKDSEIGQTIAPSKSSVQLCLGIDSFVFFHQWGQ